LPEPAVPPPPLAPPPAGALPVELELPPALGEGEVAPLLGAVELPELGLGERAAELAPLL